MGGARRLLPAVLLAAMAGVGATRAEVVPQTMNGVPLLPIPTYEEVGLPPFTMPTGTPTMGTNAPATGTGNGNTGSGGSGDSTGSPALDTMLSRSWGAAAQANVETMGVNASAVAATCMIESGGCQTLTRPGSISGTFQMLDATYRADINAAARENPALAGKIDTSLTGKLDPANQAIAAAQELKTAAQTLQRSGIENPTFMDTRGTYHFGPRYGLTLAQAGDGTNMRSLMPTYTATEMEKNGISPTMTVGQWRQSVIAKVGDAAYQPVLTRQGV